MDTTLVRVRTDRGPHGEIVRAVTPIKKGDVIFHLSGDIINAPSKYSIQLDTHRHVLTRDSKWQLINHSCEPNVRIDTELREMIAARDIAADEELNFNYNSTEWAMTSGFVCGCGTPSCVGEVRGFKYLTPPQREAIRPFLSPFIQRRWRESLERTMDDETIDIRKHRPEVQLLIPYETRADGSIASPQYDIASFHAELPTWFEPLGLDYVWRPVTLKTIPDVIRALEARRRERDIVVMNLCDGTENDQMPGKSMVLALEASGLPFSGAGSRFYINTTSKLDTKRLLSASGVPHAHCVEIRDDDRDLARAVQEIGYPLMIKPDISAGSSGIHLDSVCYDIDSAKRAVTRLKADPEHGLGPVLAEPFIEGREFTCLVVEAADQPLGLWVLPPAERVFDKSLPPNQRFLDYERYWALPGAPEPATPGKAHYWYELASEELSGQIIDIARRAMRATDGASYARVDMRYSDALKAFFVLEVNSQCGLSAEDDATVGSMLKLSGVAMPDVIERVLNHAMTRGREPLAEAV